MDVFEKLRAGQDVDMRSPEYLEAIGHMNRCRDLNFKINGLVPSSPEIPVLEKELLCGQMGEGSNIFTPFQIDFGCQMHIGKAVFINHNFTAMAAGGITIDDNVMIGPNVTIATDNHDFEDIFICVARESTLAGTPGLAPEPPSSPGSRWENMQSSRQVLS